ncbi:hypothetical protein EWM64_g2338 [Hericium alpestre]|uniref:Uncharacterized protein n=1 Tax=Hericium alpestre TaxID=135208 RepID=A0A4Z0A4P0_9AGAM|nr:hypothetical protein EWM64_g2338 [Hericium alpestre]
MGKQLHKVIFKPDPNASLVFLVIVNGPEVVVLHICRMRKWLLTGPSSTVSQVERGR